MKKFVLAAITLLVLAAAGYALTPPPPPPPVPQNIGIYDSSIDTFHTNATDQSACRACHQSTGTNVSGGYNNTIGGVPTRHHNLLPRNVTNPYTNAPFGCTDCHPATFGGGVLLDRSCTDCHNATNFWADSIGAHVGNLNRPHHYNTSYDDANIGNAPAGRQCSFCHGSFVNNYNDSHYIPPYNTSFMITPFATFKATNTSQPLPTVLFNSTNQTVLYKTWGGCESCHLGNVNNTGYGPNATAVPIGTNHNNHHREILGGNVTLANGNIINLGNRTPFVGVNYSTLDICRVCHVITPGSQFPLRFTTTNPFTGETLTNAMEVRNSTINATDNLEPGTANVTINGTGCEKCHGVSSIHNIQYNYVQNGPQGFGHINNNTDCYGCHNSWLPASTFVPGPIIPVVDSINPSVIVAGTPTTLTITGSNFVNDAYTSVVSVDGVKYTPISETATQIVVSIPALSAGVHQLQVVKSGDTLSKLSTLTVVPNTRIVSAKLSNGVITITGSGFTAKPRTNSQYYVSVKHGGKQIVSMAITSWSNNQIKARNSAAAIGDVVTVMTANAGEATATITR